jgi:hypothetical protein
VLLAWIVGEGLIIYRTVKEHHRPPMPGELLLSSGLFVMLGLMGEAQPALAATLAWGFDMAAFLALAPEIVAGPAPAQGAAAAAAGL